MNKTEQLVTYIADNYSKFIRALDIMHGGKLDSRDIIHTTIVNLYKNSHEFDSITLYAYVCARNTCRSMLRRRKLEHTIYEPSDYIPSRNGRGLVYIPHLNTGELNMTDKIDVDYGIELRMLSQSKFTKVKITNKQYKILHSRIIDGITFPEIAKETGSCTNTVKALYRHTIKNLRDSI
jgi:RNA polymerase sigma factor (sigma-70 family)